MNDIERDAARWRMLCKSYYAWDRPRYGECGTFDIFLPCKTPSVMGGPMANSGGITEHLIDPNELAEIMDLFIAKAAMR